MTTENSNRKWYNITYSREIENGKGVSYTNSGLFAWYLPLLCTRYNNTNADIRLLSKYKNNPFTESKLYNKGGNKEAILAVELIVHDGEDADSRYAEESNSDGRWVTDKFKNEMGYAQGCECIQTHGNHQVLAAHVRYHSVGCDGEQRSCARSSEKLHITSGL